MLGSLLLTSIGISLTMLVGFLKQKQSAPVLYCVLVVCSGISLIYLPFAAPIFILLLPFAFRSILDFLFVGKSVIPSNWPNFLVLPGLYLLFWYFDLQAIAICFFLAIEGYRTLRHYQLHLHKKGIQLLSNSGKKTWWTLGFLVLNLLLLLSFAISPWIEGFTSFAKVFLALISISSLFTLFRADPWSTLFDSAKYEKSSLGAAEKYRLITAIDQVFRDGIFYKSFDASLATLAKHVKGTTHQVSQVINDSKGMTFAELVAFHRIKDAKKMLVAKTHSHLSIEGIATEVGYASKAAFNKAFKNFTDQSPSEFRTSHVLPDQGVPLMGADTRKEGESATTFVAIKNSHIMLSNFLKVFVRNLSRNGIFSMLNLLGLTVGFTCSILIYLFIQDELSYDRTLPAHENIYRIAWQNDNPQTRTPHPMAQTMVRDFPEVEAAVSFEPWYGPGLTLEPIRVKNPISNESFEELGILFADSTFLDVFQLKVLEGDERALHGPSMIISSTMAKKYFGDSSAVGKQLEFNGWPLSISAVVEPLPQQSHFHFQAIISYVLMKQASPDNPFFEWGDFGHFNYIRLKDGAEAETVASKIPLWVSQYLNWGQDAIESLIAGNEKFILQPITSIHLHSNIRWELDTNGNAVYVYILVATLFFLLLIASTNYVNLTTAKSIERAKEVGIRKTLGGTSQHISVQFYLETLLFCFLALLVSFFIAGMLLDSFNLLSGKAFTYAHFFSSALMLKGLIVGLLVSLLAAFYPAIALSSFEPVKVLKGKLSTSSKGTKLRSGLVILQFTISAIMIAGSLIIFTQVEYMKDKDLGFESDAVIALNVPRDVSAEEQIDISKWRAVQTRLNALNGVKSSALSSAVPGDQINQFTYYLEEDPQNRVDASYTMIDFGYEELMGMELVEGRNFDRSFKLDSNHNVHINETMAQALGGDVIGKNLVIDRSSWKAVHTVTAVVKDFHFQSLHKEIRPLVLEVFPRGTSNLLVKLDGTAFQTTIAKIESIYDEMIESELPFEYQFLDQSMAQLYQKEEKTLSIFSIFSGIALVLASLGLLGMAMAILNQRLKEVGIRKILGASSGQILGMVLSQFLKLIGVALMIGLPLSYLLMENWMQEFSYRPAFSLQPFILSGLVLLIVAVISVSTAIIRIAFSNPVNVLRYE